LRKALKSLAIRYEDFLCIDLGSGTGRALLLASTFPFKRIVGVEMVQSFDDIARRNIASYRSKLQKCFDIVSICAEASAFPIPDEPEVFDLFNPFDAQVLGQVLSNIETSAARCPREIFIIYAHPRYRQRMDAARFLTLVKDEGGYDEYTCYCIYAHQRGS
jgi:hypothetical protein